MGKGGKEIKTINSIWKNSTSLVPNEYNLKQYWEAFSPTMILSGIKTG